MSFTLCRFSFSGKYVILPAFSNARAASDRRTWKPYTLLPTWALIIRTNDLFMIMHVMVASCLQSYPAGTKNILSPQLDLGYLYKGTTVVLPPYQPTDR